MNPTKKEKVKLDLSTHGGEYRILKSTDIDGEDLFQVVNLLLHSETNEVYGFEVENIIENHIFCNVEGIRMFVDDAVKMMKLPYITEGTDCPRLIPVPNDNDECYYYVTEYPS